MHIVLICETPRDYRAIKLVSANQWPISFKILTDLKVHESNVPSEFRSDQHPLTLSNRCLKLFGQWRPCFFEICKCPHRNLCPFRPRHCIPIFKSIERTVAQLQPFMCFLNLIAPPSGRAAQFFLFDQRLSSYICVPSLVKISHSVQELQLKQHLANVSIDAFWCTVSRKN